MKRPLKIAALAASLFVSSLSVTPAAQAAASSTQVSVTGAVTTPGAYDAAALNALPQVTQTDTFLAGTTPQTHTFTGPTIWSVLTSAGIVQTPGVKNDVLNRYVLATGTDGYKVVYSLGELNPNFGNVPDLVATSQTIAGVTGPLGASGFARTTAVGDVKGGRYVSNLSDLDVRASGSTRKGSGGGASTQFSVSGAVTSAGSFDLAALKALPQITETVGGVVYTGVSFWDFLNSKVGIAVDPTVKNDILGKYVVATGSDGYKALFSMGELDPDFGNQPDLIAFKADGELLTGNGFARLIVPNDVKAGRWVSNLENIEVFSAVAVPEPQTWALMLAGISLLAAGTRARRARSPR